MNRNILITSIGSFSADCTIKSLREINKGPVIGCDIYPREWHAVSSEFDAVLKAPPVYDYREFYTFMIDACAKYSIDMIIPLTDVDIDFFVQTRNLFAEKGIVVTIADNHFLSVARDKLKLNIFFAKDPNVQHIRSYSKHEVNFKSYFPLIAKPKNGRSSEGIFYINSKEDLNNSKITDNYIFQEIIDGTICAVDYVRSPLTGNDFALPRNELIRTKNGAGITIRTFKCDKLRKLASYIGNKLNAVGCINMEFISNEGEYYLIDINPRFSAGIGFSKLAGYDFVKSHVECFFNRDILPPADYKCIIAQKRMVDVVNAVLREPNCVPERMAEHSIA